MKSWIPKRAISAHKGDCGRIYILAGSRGMVGAGILTSWGAVKAGAGMVRLGTVASRQNVAAMRAPLEVTTDAFPENKLGHLDGSKVRRIQKTIETFKPDVIAIGPGLGASSSTAIIVRAFLKGPGPCLVLDADGLNVISPRQKKVFSKVPVVMTPHPGELARLLGKTVKQIQSDCDRSAREAALLFRCVCLLKGASTIVTDGRALWKNSTGNPSMASAGMGDVLTGVIAALWGQMKDLTLGNGFKAAVLGASLHGSAGDLAARKNGGLSVQASQVADFIPMAIRKLKGDIS